MIFEPLAGHHQRQAFACESEVLTRYLHEQAGQDMRKKLSVCFVACDKDRNILGYYTLATSSVSRELIPETYKKLLPQHYDAPVILLGRLARHLNAKGQNLGEMLLVDALIRSFHIASQSIGAMAVVVDPIDEKAAAYYRSYGFEGLQDTTRMLISMKSIAKLL